VLEEISMEDEHVPSNQVQIKKSSLYLAIVVMAIVGAIGGVVGHDMLAEPVVVMPAPEVIKEELTEAELRMLAEDLLATEAERAEAAIARVNTLQKELAEKEAELSQMKGQKAKNSEARSRLKDEIAFLRVQLASAEEEREALRKELKQTIKELDFQVAQSKKFKRKAKRYKMESTTNLWSAFQANAKVKICNKGSKKRHEKCYAAVEEALANTMRARFTVCVDTYQSVPVLKQANKGEAMPRYSAKLSQDNRFTKKGWYILFCDPTLPEASDRDLEGDDVPTWKSTYGGDDGTTTEGATPPMDGRPEDGPIDDELDLGEIDLDFE
jgi:hypothetical protein